MARITNTSKKEIPVGGVKLRPGESATVDLATTPDRAVLIAWQNAKVITVTDDVPVDPAPASVGRPGRSAPPDTGVAA